MPWLALVMKYNCGETRLIAFWKVWHWSRVQLLNPLHSVVNWLVGFQHPALSSERNVWPWLGNISLNFSFAWLTAGTYNGDNPSSLFLPGKTLVTWLLVLPFWEICLSNVILISNNPLLLCCHWGFCEQHLCNNMFVFCCFNLWCLHRFHWAYSARICWLTQFAGLKSWKYTFLCPGQVSLTAAACAWTYCCGGKMNSCEMIFFKLTVVCYCCCSELSPPPTANFNNNGFFTRSQKLYTDNN